MRVLLLALAASCSVVSLTAQQRAISDSDLFAFRWVASPQISPDGRQAAYVLVTVNAKHDGYETSLWLVNTDGASPPRRLTAGPRDGAPRWSPDGSTLAFVRPTDGRPQLYLLPLSGGEAQQLTDLPKGASPAAWSPDGKTIAFTSTTTAEDLVKKEKDKSEEAKSDVRIVTEAEFRADDEGYADPTEHAHIWTVPAGMPGDAPAKGRQVTSGEFDENAPQWSRDGTRIYFVSDRVRESYYYPPDNNFYSVPAAGGSASLDTVVDVNGPVFGPAVAPDGKTVAFRGWVNPRAVRSYNQSDLFVSRDGRARNLTADYDFDMGTHVNDSLLAKRQLVTPEDFWYPSFDGKKIETWIMKPVGFTPGKKYPLILNIHGGPHTAYGYIFFHEMQLMAARGYVVVYPNPRGSTTYGQEFGNIIQYKYPGDDYKDLMVAVDSVIRRGYVDSTRLGVTGGSGGGLLTDWTVGHTHRFAAAASQRDVADWLSFWYTADFTLFQPSWFRSTPFRDPAEFLARSPVRYADSVTTPLMFILGDADLRTPPTQGGEAMFRALKYLHRTTVQVRFPGESHELSRSGKPVHRVERLQHILNWFDKYLQGKPITAYDTR